MLLESVTIPLSIKTMSMYPSFCSPFVCLMAVNQILCSLIFNKSIMINILKYTFSERNDTRNPTIITDSCADEPFLIKAQNLFFFLYLTASRKEYGLTNRSNLASCMIALNKSEIAFLSWLFFGKQILKSVSFQKRKWFFIIIKLHLLYIAALHNIEMPRVQIHNMKLLPWIRIELMYSKCVE